jgi:hypothetical protein
VWLHVCLQVKLQSMRAKLPELVDPKPPEGEEQQADAGHNQQQQQDQQQQQRAGTSQQQQRPQGGGGDIDDIDDDELMEMQAQAAMVRHMHVVTAHHHGVNVLNAQSLRIQDIVGLCGVVRE